jgi:uncharacterized protein (DUF427 family)
MWQKLEFTIKERYLIMSKAIWNGKVIAESEKVIKVEGNSYFPPESIKKEFFQENDYHTVCPWKGKASYYDIVVDGKTNPNAAWYYPQPSSAAQDIKDYVAFWKGVTVEN